MKKILIFLLCFFGVILANEWEMRADDVKGAVPNDPTAPKNTSPKTMLKSLKGEYLGVIRRVNTDQKVVALSFDLCELKINTKGFDSELIGFLAQNNIPATLFMGGKWMRSHKERVKQVMMRQNFEIANHAWDHANMALLSPKMLKEELLWTQAQYEELRSEVIAQNAELNAQIPLAPSLFRLPYGRSSKEALKELNELGFKVIGWDVVAERGDARDDKNAKEFARQILSESKTGSIVLMHANLVPKGSAKLLKEVVKLYLENGYKFVKVSELLELGEPEIADEGYFITPNDNAIYDSKFGPKGNGEF